MKNIINLFIILLLWVKYHLNTIISPIIYYLFNQPVKNKQT